MIRIAVTGPESTGKSWLAEHLAAYYGVPWVPEFSRSYLEKLKRPYNYSDIVKIARGQYSSENELSVGAEMVVADTDFLVTYIWSKVKYNKVDPWISRMLTAHRYDVYLLCNIDIPWEYDPLREHPEMREELFSMYERKLNEIAANYYIINGLGNDRLLNAVRYIDEIIKIKS